MNDFWTTAADLSSRIWDAYKGRSGSNGKGN